MLPTSQKKNKAIYGFSSFSYTLVFINSFLSSGSSGVTRKKGGQSERKGLELASGVEGERRTMGDWEPELGEVSGTRESGAEADNQDSGVRTMRTGKERGQWVPQKPHHTHPRRP